MPDQDATRASLPTPTGPFPVGRAAYHWSDSSRHEVSARESASDRELVVWIWYPAAPAPHASPAAYLPAGWQAVGQFWGFNADKVDGHAYEDAPVANDQARYPVLVFSPAGFPPLVLSAVLQEMASHGYIVAGINHTYLSAITVFPDGRAVPMDAERMQPALGPFSGAPEGAFRGRAAIADDQTADMRFVVDQLAALDAGSERLAGRLDLSRLGAFGHSLGGNAALEYCRLDSRCRAAVNLDGGIWTAVGQVGLERPAMLLLADHAEFTMPCGDMVQMGAYPSVDWCEAERALAVGGWQATYERARPSYAAVIQGSGHISFMDLPFLPVEPGSLLAGGLASVRIDRERAWRITCDYLLAFFARYLDGVAAPLLDGPSAAYPEVALGAPRALFAASPPSAGPHA